MKKNIPKTKIQLLNDLAKYKIRATTLEKIVAKHKPHKETGFETQNRIRKLFLSLNEAFYLAQIIYDNDDNPCDYRYLEANTAFAKLINLRRKDILGKRFKEIVPVDTTGWLETFIRVATTGISVKYDFYSPEYNKYFEAIAFKPAENMFAAIVSDITESKLAEQHLKNMTEKYRVMFEHTGTATVIIENDMTISLANSQFCNLTGYSKKAIEGKKRWVDFTFPEDISWMMKQHQLRRNKPEAALNQYEFRLITRTKQIRNILLNVDIIPGTKQSIASLLDITDRKRTEEALRLSEEQFSKTFHASPFAISISNLDDGRYLDVNNKFLQLVGYTRDEIIGHSSVELNLWLNPAERERVVKSLLSKKTIRDIKTKFLTKYGRIRTWLSSLEIIDIGGKQRILSMIDDITEREDAEEALRKSEHQFRLVWENSTDGLRLTDAQGTILQVNEAFCRMVGKTKEELVEKPLAVIYQPDRQEHVIRRHQERYQSKTVKPHFEQEMTFWNGTKVFLEIINTFFEVEGKTLLLLTSFRDITKRKQVEESLQQANLVVENSPVVLFRWKAEEGWPVEYVSKNVIQFGYTPEELISGATPYASIVFPQDLERIADEVQRYSSSGVNSFQQEYRLVTKNGDIRWIDDHTIIEHDTAGNITHYQGIIIDITERKQVEETLSSTKQYLQSIMDSVHTGIVVIDPETRTIIDVNNFASKLIGVEKTKIIGQICHKFICPAEMHRCPVVDLHLTVDLSERVLTNINGDKISILKSVHPIEHNGKQYLLENFVSIEERKQAEEKLHYIERLYQNAITQTGGVVYQRDYSSPNYGFMSDGILALTGYTAEECTVSLFSGRLRKTVAYRPDNNLSYEERVRRFREGLITYWHEDYLFEKKDSTLVWLTDVSVPLYDTGGKTIGSLGILTDITDRKQAEEALTASRAQLANALDIAHLGPWEYDTDKDIFTFNNHFYNLFHTSAEKEGGYTMPSAEYARKFVHPEDIALVGKEIKIMLESSDPNYSRKLEHRILYADGGEGYITVQFYTIRDNEGRIIKSYGVNQDITDRKLAEERFREIFNKANDGIEILENNEHNIPTKFIDVNEISCKMLGYTREELLQLNLADIDLGIMNLDHKTIEGKITKQGHVMIETLHRRKDGTLFPVEVHAHQTVLQGKRVTLSITRDITDRKLAEEKIMNLNSLVLSIRKVNEILVRTKDETQLYQQVCDALLDVSYIKFVWIGLIEPSSYVIKPIAFAGEEDGYLSTIKISWDDSEYGSGPTGTAIKTKKPSIINDIATDSHFGLWQKEALKRGFVSSIALPLIHENKVIGILRVYSGIKHAFGEEAIGFLNEVSQDIAVGIKSIKLETKLEQTLIHLRQALNESIETIAKISEVRDPYTAGHQKRVAKLAMAIAQEMGLPERTIDGIRVTGYLHDLGKLVIPAEILSKPTRLTKTEFDLIKIHPQTGYDILSGLIFPWPVAEVILQHHERLNGAGYPRGLKGDEILLEAKIIAVADVVEAMSSHRPYRPSLGLQPALDEIKKNTGILYDAKVVDACICLFQENRFNFEKD